MVAARTSWIIRRILVSSSNPPVRDLARGGGVSFGFYNDGLLMYEYNNDAQIATPIRDGRQG